MLGGRLGPDRVSGPFVLAKSHSTEMARYQFILYGAQGYQKTDGTLLTSDEAAVAHAGGIARMLDGHRVASRDWMIVVVQGDREVEIIDFATVQ